MDKFIDLNFFNLKNTSFLDETFKELNRKLFKTRLETKNIFRQFSKYKKIPNQVIINDIIKAERNINKKPYFNFFYSLYKNNTLFYQKINDSGKKQKYYLDNHYLQDKRLKIYSFKILNNFFDEGETPLYRSRILFFKESIKYCCIIVLFFIKYLRSLE